MNTINIAEYIRHGMILRNFAENDLFDAIVFESFENDKIEIPETLTIETLNSTNTSDICAQLLALCEHHERTCLILDSLQLVDIIPFLKTALQGSEKEWGGLTIINLGTWASGLFNKWVPELHDIWVAMEWRIPTYEPHDFVSLFSHLSGDSVIKYIRIIAWEYSGNLFPDQKIELHSWCVDLTKFELKWKYATLLAHGWHIAACIQAHPALKEQKKSCDIFLLTRYWLPSEPTALLKSIEKTKKLIVVIDQHELTSYTYYLQSRLFENGVTNLEMIEIITPDMSAITTNQVHSLYEQAGLGAEGIVAHVL